MKQHCCHPHLGFKLGSCQATNRLLPPLTTACTGEEHHGRKEEAAQALGTAQAALTAARGELAHLQEAAAAAEASAPDWEVRLAAARAELDAAQAASREHQVRSQASTAG